MAGADQPTFAVIGAPGAPLVAVGAASAPGALAGVTLADATDGALTPPALTARTRKLYAVPLVRPVTVVWVGVTGRAKIVLITVVPVRTCTRYAVIGEPPLLIGATHRTVACALPRVAVTPVGGSGRPAGVTGADGADSGLAPTPFSARTWNVYAVPLVRLVTFCVVAPAAMPVMVRTTVPPRSTSSSWLVMAGTPMAVPGVQLTVAEALPAVAVTPLGAVGAPTSMVTSENWRCSMLRSVSMPSDTLCPTGSVS